MGALRPLLGSVWVRVTISVCLIAAVLARVGPDSVADALRGARVSLVLAAVGALVAAFVVAAERWRVFLRAAGLPVGRIEALRVTFIGALTTNVLPGAVGGDAARAWLVGPGRRTQGLASVLVDRVTLFGCSVLLGWLAFPYADAPRELAAALVLTTAVCVGLALVASGVVDVGGRLGARVHRFRARIAVFAVALRDCVARPRVLAATTALGLVYQSFVVLEVWLLCRALDLDVSYGVVASVTPAVLLLSALPLSIGGIGIREVSYVTLLAPVGVAASDATSLGLLVGIAYFAASLPGAVAVAQRKTGAREASAGPAASAAELSPSRT